METNRENSGYCMVNIATQREPGELNIYSCGGKERNIDLKVAASEMERAQTGLACNWGYGSPSDLKWVEEWYWESQPERVKVLSETLRELEGTSTTRHVGTWKSGDHPLLKQYL